MSPVPARMRHELTSADYQDRTLGSRSARASGVFSLHAWRDRGRHGRAWLDLAGATAHADNYRAFAAPSLVVYGAVRNAGKSIVWTPIYKSLWRSCGSNVGR